MVTDVEETPYGYIREAGNTWTENFLCEGMINDMAHHRVCPEVVAYHKKDIPDDEATSHCIRVFCLTCANSLFVSPLENVPEPKSCLDNLICRARSFRKLTLKYLWNNLAWAAIHFTANLLSLKEILESSPNIDFFFLSYEELKENYDTVVKSITKFCELPVVASETELRIPGDDSQKNSWLSRENLAKHKTNLNAEDIAKVDAVLEDCDLPKCSVFPVRGADLMKIIAKGRQ